MVNISSFAEGQEALEVLSRVVVQRSREVTAAEVRRALEPYGSDAWTLAMARRHGLHPLCLLRALRAGRLQIMGVDAQGRALYLVRDCLALMPPTWEPARAWYPSAAKVQAQKAQRAEVASSRRVQRAEALEQLSIAATARLRRAAGSHRHIPLSARVAEVERWLYTLPAGVSLRVTTREIQAAAGLGCTPQPLPRARKIASTIAVERPDLLRRRPVGPYRTEWFRP